MHKRYTTILSLAVGATVLAGIVQTMPNAEADSGAASSTASVVVSASCSLSGGASHSKTINNGQSDTIGTSTFKALCNDPSGFAIYTVGYGQDTLGNNKLHSDTLATTYDIETNTSGSASYWSMQASPVSGTYAPTIRNSFGSAHAVPSAYTKIADFTSTTDATIGSSMNVTYAASISSTQPAGTYTGKVKYVLVHPSGSAPSDNLTMQSVDVWKDTMLAGETYKVSDARDNKEYYVAKLDDGNVWMTQNLDLCIGCTGTAILTSDNTDIDPTTAGTGIYTNGYAVDASGVATWTPAGNATVTGTPATITFVTGSQANTVSGWTNDTATPYMAEGGASNYVAGNMPYTTRQACVDVAGAVACDHGQVGNYYNWTAAVASNASGSMTTKFADAGNSICPKGWRLPDGPDGTNGSDFNTMLSMANIANGVDNGSGSAVNVGFKDGGRAKMEGSPYYFGRYGNVYGTTFYDLTGNGNYWSGSAVSGSDSFDLTYSGSGLYPADQRNRGNGRSVRCIAR